MIKYNFSFMLLLFLTACSFKTPINEWQYNSTNAFSSYTKNFLSSNDILAQSDLSRAIEHAKKSANLTQLGKIYLGKCALDISVGINKECKKYLEISEVINNQKLDAYYAFISLEIKKSSIEYLPQRYQEFTPLSA